MFRLDPTRLDKHIDGAMNRRSGRAGAQRYPDSAAPGFTIGQVFVDVVDGSHGPRTQALEALVYRVFVKGHGLARGPSSTPGKPVLFDRGRRLHGAAAPYLAVTAGADRVLIPCPRLPDALITGEPFPTVGEARAQLHKAVQDIVERVNLAWPVAVALAQEAETVAVAANSES